MIMDFANKNQFLLWINTNVDSSEGIWIRFEKGKGNDSLTAEEALDISLCYGWIDGKMKTEGDNCYIKYFSKRSEKSKWSEKNKKSVERLRGKGLMTKYGEEAVKNAVINGQWDKEKVILDFDSLIIELSHLLSDDKSVINKFNNLSPSEKKRYCGFYFEAKTSVTREKRLTKIKTALIENTNGMLF